MLHRSYDMLKLIFPHIAKSLTKHLLHMLECLGHILFPSSDNRITCFLRSVGSSNFSHSPFSVSFRSSRLVFGMEMPLHSLICLGVNGWSIAINSMISYCKAVKPCRGIVFVMS